MLLLPWYWVSNVDSHILDGALSLIALSSAGTSQWLVMLLAPLIILTLSLWPVLTQRQTGILLTVGAVFALALCLGQGFAIGLKGWV